MKKFFKLLTFGLCAFMLVSCNEKEKKIDVAIAGMSITPERAKAVNFSIPYLTSNVAIIANKSKPINGKEDLINKTYGAELGTTKEAVARKIEGASVVPFSSNTAALVAVNLSHLKLLCNF